MCYQSRQVLAKRRTVRYSRFSICFVSSLTNMSNSFLLWIEYWTVHCTHVQIVHHLYRSIWTNRRNLQLYQVKRSRRPLLQRQRLILWIGQIILEAKSIYVRQILICIVRVRRWKCARKRECGEKKREKLVSLIKVQSKSID